jgi:hypothetical protein
MRFCAFDVNTTIALPSELHSEQESKRDHRLLIEWVFLGLIDPA